MRLGEWIIFSGSINLSVKYPKMSKMNTYNKLMQ